MKNLLNVLISLCLISCSSRTDQRQQGEKSATEQADSVVLADLLAVDGPPLDTSEPSKAERRIKTVPFNSLSARACNTEAILYVYENIDSLSVDAIDIFLAAFSDECDINVEFSEFSQEMIFDVFARYPQDIVALLSKNDYDMAALTDELESPLLDPVIRPIISGIEQTGVHNPKVDSVLAALERANEYLTK
ncbi:hypothetical protein [uncultured Imperialibacter sp.]|uniref:hypothetical protein n=1 Tax=uncultured Imperialibacter sp. TaxID=1672639 RepID=UPI0030D89851|tara:strand:- start:21759 stop:22334 length:576 start_codon:yes stop_codon:yes gene_type:complete